MKKKTKEHAKKGKPSGNHEEKRSRTHKEKSKTMNYALIVLVGLLLFFSVMQSMQISELKTEMGKTVVVTTTSETQTATPAVTQPVQAAPSMVGGC